MPKLHLGAGNEIREGFVNQDIRPLPGIDLVCDAREIPYIDNYFDEILANDLLEHMPRLETEKTLREWNRILKIGGFLILKVPNLDVIFAWYYMKIISPEEAVRRIFGTQDYPENTHKTIFTLGTLYSYLTNTNYRVLDVKIFPEIMSTNLQIKAEKC